MTSYEQITKHFGSLDVSQPLTEEVRAGTGWRCLGPDPAPRLALHSPPGLDWLCIVEGLGRRPIGEQQLMPGGTWVRS